MKLTDQEFDLIRNAKKVVSNAHIKTLGLLILVGIGFVAFILGVVSSTAFAGLCMVTAISSILFLHIGKPSYQELVVLLSKVEENSEHVEKDPIIEALSQKP